LPECSPNWKGVVMSRSPLSRPKTLAEVAAGSPTYQDFGRNLKDFLHVFAEERRLCCDPRLMFAEEPMRLAPRFAEGIVCDGFLAGAADHLSRTHGVPTPLWALREDRILPEPWFAESHAQARMRLLRDTPSAFKDKNIFVFESALNVV
jgi:hypothetical protein